MNPMILSPSDDGLRVAAEVTGGSDVLHCELGKA